MIAPVALAPSQQAAASIAIQHIIVVELENESFGSTFGPSSAATYPNDRV